MDNNTNPILAEDKQQYEKEQNELLKTILDLRFFNPWRLHTSYTDIRSLQNDSNLELYVTNTCNQNCSYCYLPKYPELYPAECNNAQTIIKNLKILFQYCIDNQFYIPNVDFFSGEIWHTLLGTEILETTYDYLINKGLQVGKITIPTNGTFAANDVTFQRIQQFIDRFNDIGVSLNFSLSIDGKYVDQKSRQRNDGIPYTDDFYDSLFAFAKINGFGFHPIVNGSDMDVWPQNLQWWIQQCEKYNINFNSEVMFLECRNNNEWTDERINQFCDLMTTMMEYYLHHSCHDKVSLFADGILGITSEETRLGGYHPWTLTENSTFLGCTVQQFLAVRLGDLAICPCHRQAYDKYLYGKFVVEDDHIVDIKAINPYMAIKILMGNTRTCLHGCATCKFNNYCLKGCFGSQLETLKDPFFPIESICNFFKKKYTFLVNYYTKLGVFDYYAKYPIDTPEARLIASLLQLKLIVEEQKNE